MDRHLRRALGAATATLALLALLIAGLVLPSTAAAAEPAASGTTTISGTVTLPDGRSDIETVTVVLAQSNGGGFGLVLTEQQTVPVGGSYRFEVGPGTYAVVAFPVSSFMRTHPYTPVWSDGTSTGPRLPTDPGSFAVTAASPPVEHDLELLYADLVQGQVTDENGVLTEAVDVVPLVWDGATWVADYTLADTTNPDGTFRMRRGALPAGAAVTFVATKFGIEFAYLGGGTVRPTGPPAQVPHVVVPASGDLVVPTIRRVPPASVALQGPAPVDARGVPVAARVVVWRWVDAGSYSHWERYASREVDGGYWIPVPPGQRLTVSWEASGYRTAWYGGGTALPARPDDRTSLTTPTRGPLDVGPAVLEALPRTGIYTNVTAASPYRYGGVGKPKRLSVWYGGRDGRRITGRVQVTAREVATGRTTTASYWYDGRGRHVWTHAFTQRGNHRISVTFVPSDPAYQGSTVSYTLWASAS
ncbi:hypothetical protein RDV89_03310 [Nocardioides zeae]|uniref:Carboxypeptidase regulatory-like domain-containing protein n=1 Tax=Nocardioides imazamoxiresistens TaxID=3231893 RepID=A0ABU3PTA8_9ACTN|nr:hypothetical protein [Nocardioides zeae]MDT9592077.1 hypothetical protein [Nocardioides zeae]